MREVPTAYIATYAVVFAVIVGLIVPGRWRLSLFFLVYNAVGLAFGLLQFLWPERMVTGTVWILIQASLDVLKLGVALEIAWRTFRPFPGAVLVARVAILPILAVTTVVAIAVPLVGVPASAYETAVTQFHPRLLDGTIWVIAATLAWRGGIAFPCTRFMAAC